ncbi:MAG TPA: RluA family pseudouridine synthase [Polyangiaceae bacterium]|nr:RluA family pseudouridine synthase [Polyangiaceae bacterium]
MLARAGEPRPRAEVQRWMADGSVLVDGRAVAKKTALVEGQKVEVVLAPPPLSEAEPDPTVTVNVVAEDDHLLVVDKQAGLVVHPARGHETGTLVNGLLARGGFEADNADPRDETGHLRPGIVHRLDKDTSGLLVVAKTPRCREGLKLLFQTHDIERSYLAITNGVVRAAVRFDTTHGRHPTQRLKFTSRLPDDRPNVRRAVTEVEPLERFDGATLVRCTLETGRTHQIRVHLAEQAGAPILADGLYGRPPHEAALRAIAERLGRQALHANLLGFVHPITGARCRWEAPLPADMARALAALRATR